MDIAPPKMLPDGAGFNWGRAASGPLVGPRFWSGEGDPAYRMAECRPGHSAPCQSAAAIVKFEPSAGR